MSQHILYYSSLCPDTTAFVAELDKLDLEYEKVDITASMANLKQFLRLRDERSEFSERKKWGLVGVPCFVTKTGRCIFEINELNGTACGFVPIEP